MTCEKCGAYIPELIGRCVCCGNNVQANFTRTYSEPEEVDIDIDRLLRKDHVTVRYNGRTIPARFLQASSLPTGDNLLNRIDISLLWYQFKVKDRADADKLRRDLENGIGLTTMPL